MSEPFRHLDHHTSERQREQARVHARFTRQRKQELFDKLQSQYNELLNAQLKTELKANEDLALSRLLKQKVLQLLDMWSDAGSGTKSSTEIQCCDLAEVAELLDPQVRALLPSYDFVGKTDKIDADDWIARQEPQQFQSLSGIEGMLKGIASIALQQPHKLGFPAFELKFAAEVALDTMFTGERAAMCPFWYRSFNALECGASREVALRGMLYCEFSLRPKVRPATDSSPIVDKSAVSLDVSSTTVKQPDDSAAADSTTDAVISGAKVVYDCAAWVREVTSAFAWELPEISSEMVVPTNLNQAYAAMAASGAYKPMLLTTLAPPRKIVRVTERYCRLTGYHPRELLGNALMWLDPPCEDQRSRLTELVSDLRRGEPLSAMMVHPTNLPSTKSGHDCFSGGGIYTFTQAYPLTGSTDDDDDEDETTDASNQFSHCLWVLKYPPEPPTLVPCVRSLLELGVRLASIMHGQPPTTFADHVFSLLESMLLQEPPESIERSPATSLPPGDTADDDALLGGAGPTSPKPATTKPASLEERFSENRERHVVVCMWDLYKLTRELWSRVHELSPTDKRVAKALGTTWSQFFAQVRAAGADEPFASFIERARHFSVARGDETVSFILRRFASLALNFHRDWVSGGTINDSVPHDRKNEVERAVAVYTKVIDTWPEYAQAWNRRARAHFLLGDYDKADADIIRALELQPTNSSAWVGRMLVKMKQQHYALALDAYKQAIKLNPALDIAQKGLESPQVLSQM